MRKARVSLGARFESCGAADRCDHHRRARTESQSRAEPVAPRFGVGRRLMTPRSVRCRPSSRKSSSTGRGPILNSKRSTEARRTIPGKLHAGLALLPVDADRADYLLARLLEAGPLKSRHSRCVGPHKDALIERLWSAAEQTGEGTEGRRLRAGVRVGDLRPRQSAMGKDQCRSRRRPRPGAGGLSCGVGLPAAAGAIAARRAIGGDLSRCATPRVGAISRRTSERLRGRSGRDAGEPGHGRQRATRCRAVSAAQRRTRSVAPDRLLAAIQASATDHKDESAQRLANAAVALLRMGRPEAVWPLLNMAPTRRCGAI